MKIEIEITADELRSLVLQKLQRITGTELDASDILIEVKSTQNYKSEWETAHFRARVNTTKELT